MEIFSWGRPKNRRRAPMTARKRPAEGTAEGTKNTPSSAKVAPDQGKQPARKRTESAPTPVKMVRKGRAPTAGARLQRELRWPKADHAAELLITQAGRVADRLEVINRLLSGDPGAWLAVKVAGQVVEVRVTDVVREERQQSEVLRKLIMDIQKMRAAADLKGGKGGGGSDGKPVALARIVADIYGKRV